MGVGEPGYLDMSGVFRKAQGVGSTPVVRTVSHHGQMERSGARENEGEPISLSGLLLLGM